MLSRPDDHRLREYKYRCAQTIIFGLPVLVLQLCGTSLGGPEAARWVWTLQAVLTGWILYVAATGMLFEGLLKLRSGITADLLVATIACFLYIASIVSALYRAIAPGGNGGAWLHWCVILLAVWTALQWRRFHVKLAALSRSR